MFRLEFLRLKEHPQLSDFGIDLFDFNQADLSNSPYTSVIIGSNGTGKSFILRTIAEIFRELKKSQESNLESIDISFGFDVGYQINGIQYRVIQAKDLNKRSKSIQVLKNDDINKRLDWRDDILEELTKTYSSISELKFPKKLIVNSVMLTDRFVWQNSNPTDFYQYLGVRSTKTTSSTQTSSRRTIKHLFNATKANSNYAATLKELLMFLDFQDF